MQLCMGSTYIEFLAHGFIVCCLNYKDDNPIDQFHGLQRGSKQVNSQGENIAIRGNYLQISLKYQWNYLYSVYSVSMYD